METCFTMHLRMIAARAQGGGHVPLKTADHLVMLPRRLSYHIPLANSTCVLNGDLAALYASTRLLSSVGYVVKA